MLETLYARRSIRKFTQEPVEPEQARELLKAAMAAPTSRNSRPWHFVVVQERESLDRLADLHPYGKMLSQATLCIAVVADPSINRNSWTQDCSAATQNILLAATALGLGSCWLGMYPKRDRTGPIGEFLGVPDSMEILSLVALGHPAEEQPPRTQYDPERIHRERW